MSKEKAVGFLASLGVVERVVSSTVSLGMDYVGNKLSSSLTVVSSDPGFHHILEWLEKIGYTSIANHLKYTADRVETSPADGVHFLTWQKKTLLLSVTSSEPTAFGGITKTFVIRVLGGSREDINKILAEIKTLKDDNCKDRIPIYSYESWWNLVAKKKPRLPETLFYEDNLLETLAKECATFFESEEEYNKKGTPWRRGFLLYGKPGNGKSSLVFGIASQLKLPIYVVNLTSPDSLGQMLNRIENGEKALILIEEIDTFEVSRNDENKPIPTADNPTLTTHKVFGDFLNSLDGITAKEGIIMFATTNHREKLDEATIRPGRFDRQIEIGNCSSKLAEKMFSLYFPDKPVADKLEFAKQFKKKEHSVCQVQEELLKLTRES